MARPITLSLGLLLAVGLLGHDADAQSIHKRPIVPSLEASQAVPAPPTERPASTQTAPSAEITSSESNSSKARSVAMWMGIALVVVMITMAIRAVRRDISPTWFEGALSRARTWASQYLRCGRDTGQAADIATDSLGGILCGARADEFLAKAPSDQDAFLRAAVRNLARRSRRRSERYRGDIACDDQEADTSRALDSLALTEFQQSLDDDERDLLAHLEEGRSVRETALLLSTSPYRLRQRIESLQKRFQREIDLVP